jgi:hypothetical protein
MLINTCSNTFAFHSIIESNCWKNINLMMVVQKKHSYIQERLSVTCHAYSHMITFHFHSVVKFLHTSNQQKITFALFLFSFMWYRKFGENLAKIWKKIEKNRIYVRKIKKSNFFTEKWLKFPPNKTLHPPSSRAQIKDQREIQLRWKQKIMGMRISNKHMDP